ncbi:two-component system sensor histidine kinase NtrB [Desulfarculus baarsii]
MSAPNQDHRLLLDIVDNSPAIVFAKNHQGRFTLSNRTHGWAVGRAVEEIIGRGDEDLFDPITARRRHDEDLGVIRSGRAVFVGEWLPTPSGPRFFAGEKFALRDAQGRVYGMCGILHDLTEHGRADDPPASHAAGPRTDLEHKRRLELLGTLAGGVAHDFRNILTGLLAYAELALTDQTLAANTRARIESLIKAGHRGRELTERIVLFARRREGGDNLIWPAPVIGEAMALLATSLPASVRLRAQLDRAAGPLRAEAVDLHQIVMNLVGNAAQALGESGGQISVGLSAEASSASGDHPCPPSLVLTVADDGPGMDEQTRQRAFEPYFTTRGGSGGGAGLGLFLVRGIAESLGGGVELGSAPGHGTTVRVVLPSAPRHEQSPP